MPNTFEFSEGTANKLDFLPEIDVCQAETATMAFNKV